MKINLTKLTDEQLSELRQACDEECLWLCKRRGHSGMHDFDWDCSLCNTCPAKIGNSITETLSLCTAHTIELITKQQIASACDAEIERRWREKTTPHWEMGLRVHGYWRGMERLGWVSLSPRPKIRGSQKMIYTWCVDCEDPKPVNGMCFDLRTAKRMVERIVKGKE